MNEFKSSISLAILLTVFLTIGYTAGAATTYFMADLNENVEITPECNVECPEPQRSIQPQVNIEDTSGAFNYIQAPYTPVDFDYNGNELSVNVDALVRPEGKSMRPTIFSGNTLLMQEYTGETLSEGQIIRFRNGDGYTVHRIEGVYTTSSGIYLTRGDNNDASERVNQEDITHVVKGVLFTDLENNREALSN